MNFKRTLSKLKNNNPWLKILWFKRLAKKRSKALQISDREVIEEGYKKVFNALPNLEDPKLFFEKLQWLKLYYRNKLMPVVSDKYEVRAYLDNLGYGYLLNNLLGVWDNLEKFNHNSLPEKFVLKATHASGDAWNLIVKNKKKINWFANKKVMNQWLHQKIDWLGREWHYGEMKPRIIAEKFLEDNSGELRDYKFHCVDGIPQFVIICIGRYTDKKIYLTFDKDWTLLPFTNDSKELANEIDIPKPENYEKMWELASELSKPFPYVRVDFYNVNGKIYFGEFTFFSSSGFEGPYTEEAQKYMGDAIKLPEQNNFT